MAWHIARKSLSGPALSPIGNYCMYVEGAPGSEKELDHEDHVLAASGHSGFMRRLTRRRMPAHMAGHAWASGHGIRG